MNRSESIAALTAALAKAQGTIEGAVKDAKNPHFRSSYADLQSVWEAVRGPLSSNGLAILQFPEVLEGQVVLETVLTHESGEFVSSCLAIPLAKEDAQAIGSAITYARRYALQSVTGVAPMDDDGEGAVGRGEERMRQTDERREAEYYARRAEMPAEAPRKPAEAPVTLRGWKDTQIHFGKNKGKRLGDLTDKSRAWYLEHMESSDKPKIREDNQLIAALRMWQAEKNGTEEGDANAGLRTFPANGTEYRDKLTDLLDFNGIPLQVFMAVANKAGWVQTEVFDKIPEDTAKALLDMSDAILDACNAAREGSES